ncbi:ABC transporter substrate-binding protein [Maridesulfovibrio frigidus]|uniref:ABC transporter substrate-binding protein n=1 Tax=Maridesulfovibrio frigidus TaxID=340956 RepID=UPI0004E1E393|nr:ABC transporter substrate-binding protein [Maridesulfovibrio frigidus]
MKKLILTIAFLILFSSAVSAGELNLGGLFQIKGKSALTAQEAMNGAILAIKKFNDASHDLKIQIDLESPTDDPREIIKAVSELTSTTGISAATGVISSGTALTAGPAFQAAQVPFLSTGAEIDGLTGPETPNVFTLAVPDSTIGRHLAKYTYATLEAENIFLIRSSMSDAIAGQAESFAQNYKKLGGTILKQLEITTKNSDLSYIINAIEALAPLPESDSKTTIKEMGATNFIDEGAVFITQNRTSPPEIQEIEAIVILTSTKVSTELLSLMKEKKINYNIVGGTNFDAVTIVKPIESWPGNIVFASQASLTRPDKLVTLFVKAYSEMFGTKPLTGYSALGFDSISLLAHAAGKTGNKSANIRANLSATKNFQGVSGNITFVGRSAQKPLYIIQSDRGELSLAAEMQ